MSLRGLKVGKCKEDQRIVEWKEGPACQVQLPSNRWAAGGKKASKRQPHSV